MSARELLKPTHLLAAAMLAAAVGVLWLTRGHSLLFDEWSFFADYRGAGPSTLLNPFGGNLEVVPVLAYKLVFELAGPEPIVLRALLVVCELICALLFFTLVRARVGDWIALAATVLLLFLGAAADVVAATLGLAIVVSTAAGLGALVALERHGRAADLAASVLLGISVGSNSIGLAFAAGVAVQVLVADREHRSARAWIAGAPLLLYAVWRVWSLHLDPLGPLAAHPTEVSLSHLGTLPTSVADSAAQAIATITGLFVISGGEARQLEPSTGSAVLVALVGLAVLRLVRGPAPDRRLLAFLVMPLVYWALIALAADDRLPTVSRYQYPGAVFVLLLGAELARGIRIGPRATAAVCAGLLVGLAPNLLELNEGARFLRSNGQINRAELAAIEIAGERADYQLLVEPVGGRFDPSSPTLFSGGRFEPTTDALISVGRYRAAARDYGSAAFSIGELEAAPGYAREAADRELVVALGLRSVPAGSVAPVEGAAAPAVTPIAGRAAAGEGGCVALRPPSTGPGAAELTLPAGGFAVKGGTGAPVSIALGRFGDRPVVALDPAPPGRSVAIAIPPDQVARPWRARLDYSGGALACPLKS